MTSEILVRIDLAAIALIWLGIALIAIGVVWFIGRALTWTV